MSMRTPSRTRIISERSESRPRSSMAAAGLMVVGSGPRAAAAEPPPQLPPAPNAEDGVSRKPQYRAWTNGTTLATPDLVAPKASAQKLDSPNASGSVAVSVKYALSHNLVASFAASPDWTFQDISEKLQKEAPLPPEKSYQLIVGDEIPDTSKTLLSCGCSSDSESFEILAYVRSHNYVKLDENANVAACLETIRQLPGHLGAAAYRRDLLACWLTTTCY